jgi:hypothetical protein
MASRRAVSERFLLQRADTDLSVSSVTVLGSVIILVALTAVTWIWLGGKEGHPLMLLSI